MVLCPSQDIVEITALVNSIKDGEDVHVLSFPLDPALSKQANITRALELLPDDIETVVYAFVSITFDHSSGSSSKGVKRKEISVVLTNVKLDYWFRVFIYTGASVTIIVDIPGKRLAYHVLNEGSARIERSSKWKQYQAVKMM
jgi:hypothetical protein